MDAAAAPGGRDGEEKEEKRGSGGGDAGDKRVSFTGLFRYADGTDVMLMLLGTVGALANGVTQPIMTLIFGQVIDAFGGSVAMGDVLQRVNKVSLPEAPPPR
jgi:ATP-binding cassette subfamily B (MDR/TAP) protein 1